MAEEVGKKRIKDYGWWIIPVVVLCFLMLPCFCMDKVFDLAFGPEAAKPMRPKPVAEELARAAGEGAGKIKGFAMFDLGGFIDHEYLWRFEAPPEVVSGFVSTLKLERVDVVPEEFWELDPTDWPRAMPEGAEGYMSPGFKPRAHKSEGDLYLLMYDKEKGEVYVWFKKN